MSKDKQSSDMGGGSGSGFNTGSNKEFLIKGNQVFDAQYPNVALGTIRNFQGGTGTEGGLGGTSSTSGKTGQNTGQSNR